MKNKPNHITVFEHQSIRLGQKYDDTLFDEDKLKALQRFYGEKGVPYFSLIHRGVRLNNYVGVIQVGNLVIEVLPKADNTFEKTNEKNQWRDILIDMLRAVGAFTIHTPSSSALKLKSNSILDLYFELFVKEVEFLLHSGLVKKYRKKESNVKALKGSLQFGKHIQQNLTHKERFFVRHTTYDVEHQLHFILYKTIRLLKQINTNVALHSRIGALLLHFPEMQNVKVTESTFDKLVFNRKTQSYKKAIEIARLLLLKYHPDVSSGRNDVLALMFDMNQLWEQFVYISLRKHKSKYMTMTAQTTKKFWRPEKGYTSKMRPDIVINKGREDCVVLDTKWKNIKSANPSPDDLRQMYVYCEYYKAKRVALVYPGARAKVVGGVYLDPGTGEERGMVCSVICLSVNPVVHRWQEDICEELGVWMNESLPV